MPSIGDGTGWDETLPTDSGKFSDTGLEIRDVRKAVRIRLEKEHDTLASSSAGGEHKKGSAKAYCQNTFPTKRPNGTTDLSSNDAGRVLVRSDTYQGYWWDGTGWQLLKVTEAGAITDGILTKEKVATGFTAGILPYAILLDSKASGTDGGGFTSGSWETRDLQTTHSDDGSIVSSLSSNQFTLAAGTYRIRARATAYQVDQHQIRLRRDLSGTPTTAAYGLNASAPNGVAVMTESTLETVVTLSGTEVFELQHRCTTTKASTGRGIANSYGTIENYASVEIWKLL